MTDAPFINKETVRELRNNKKNYVAVSNSDSKGW